MAAAVSPRVLLVWDRMGDYHRARWRALAHELALTHPAGGAWAADLGQADQLYQWQNTAADGQYVALSQKPLTQPDLVRRLVSFVRTLRRHRITAVGIAGYGRPEYLLMLLYARFTGRRVVLFAESWYGQNRFLNYLKGTLLRALCYGFLVSGQRAHDHFARRLGVPVARLRRGYSVVDNAHFATAPQAPTLPTPHLADDATRVVLCVARFSPEKNLAALIAAFVASPLARTHQLHLVGGGPLFDELCALAQAHASVVLRPWVDYQQLPALYQSAEVLVLPSTFEPWGLVVNEAMAAGLPLVLSRQCGCAPDLLTDRNGWLFDAAAPGDLARALADVARTDPATRRAMGAESRRIVAAFTPRNWARQFLALLN